MLLDCGADPRPSFADLGEAIRRCRIDFGAEIDLDVGQVLETDARSFSMYHLENDEFPQQATLDQWYDEAQFESYRKLGYDSVLTALPRWQGPFGRAQVQAYFEALPTRWTGPIPSPRAASRVRNGGDGTDRTCS